jgi:hypothetical protein
LSKRPVVASASIVSVATVCGALVVSIAGSSSARRPAQASAAPAANSAGRVRPTPPVARVSARPFPRRAYVTLRPGTVVASAAIARTVFADARHGFALASVGDWTYPAATVDGGRRWRIDGPSLPISFGAVPVAVTLTGVAGPETYFASAGLQDNTIVEVTTDAGDHWWQALLPAHVVYVGAFQGELTAIVAHPRRGVDAAIGFWAYQSKTGRAWTYNPALDFTS